jgi:hypothetical protein
MRASRQLIRFSIPGAVLLLALVGSIALGRLLQGAELAGVASALDSNVGALGALLASIPIGFLVYQVYYLAFRPRITLTPWIRIDRGARVLSVLRQDELWRLSQTLGLERSIDLRPVHKPAGSRLGRLVKAIRLDTDEIYEDAELQVGMTELREHGDVLTSQQTEALSVNEVNQARDAGRKVLLDAYADRVGRKGPKQESELREQVARDLYRRRWYANWDALRSLIELSSRTAEHDRLREEYVGLSDVYHALGATAAAIVIAWLLSAIVLGCSLAFASEHSVAGAIEATLLTGAMALSMWFLLNQTRRQTWKSIEKALRNGLRASLNLHSEVLGRVPEQPFDELQPLPVSPWQTSFGLEVDPKQADPLRLRRSAEENRR